MNPPSDRSDLGMYFQIAEATGEGIWIIDASGITTFFNSHMAGMLGHDVGEILGQSPFDFRDVEIRELAAMIRARHRLGLDGPIDFRFVRQDGSDVWTSIRVSPIHGVEGTYGGALAIFSDVTQRKSAEADVAYLRTHDLLTGLPNRALLIGRLEMAVRRSLRQGTSLAVLSCDLDRFNVINESMGRAAGDIVLATIASRLDAVMDPGDTVARIGDDEFIVCCEGLDDDAQATRGCDRIASALEAPVDIDGRDVFVTASIGIRVVTGFAEPAEVLLRDADAAMYRAKRSGGACSSVFDDSLRLKKGRRLALECDLHGALERGELHVRYQPVISVSDGVLAGVEALLRWERPGKGTLAPADFIAIAEDTGLILPIGLWVLDQACRQLHEWDQLGAGPLTMAVNVSPRQLRSPAFVTQVAEVVRRTGVRPGDVCLEVTETVLIEDAGVADSVLASLRALGVRIALDDFGTGYSSLNHLHQFPVDVLKIDRSFISNLGADVEATVIVTSVVRLAQGLGLEVVAEGVDTAEQLQHLRLLGCQLAQGYFWSRPVPPDQLGSWLEPILHTPPSTSGAPHAKLRVLLADDETAYRSTLKRILERSGHFSVVAEALDGQMAVDLSKCHHPDLVLLDLSMPRMGGLEALPGILAGSPGTKVAILSGQIGKNGNQPIPDGASACLGKVVEPSLLVDALLSVANNGTSR
jgi:diguanylate cyclase (GGDEF)-like protein/PAS domain S-box-containing protein